MGAAKNRGKQHNQQEIHALAVRRTAFGFVEFGGLVLLLALLELGLLLLVLHKRQTEAKVNTRSTKHGKPGSEIKGHHLSPGLFLGFFALLGLLLLLLLPERFLRLGNATSQQ